MQKKIRLGTRGSPLALIQAEEVQKKLRAAQPNKGNAIEIVPIRTSGDWKPGQKEQRFIELGGNKGLFTKEIEEALISGAIDMAVHSMKDVASFLPEALEIAAIMERLDPRDAFIGRAVRNLDELPQGATVGTCSLRRQAQLLAQRPDLNIVPLRGNVETRLKKLADSRVDATLLAVAGLTRLNLNKYISSVMELDSMMPAAAQGAIGIEIRRGDAELRAILQALNAPLSFSCIEAERALLRVLEGDCETPIGVHARKTGEDHMTIDVVAARANGKDRIRLRDEGALSEAQAVGMRLGMKLKEQLPPDFFAAH